MNTEDEHRTMVQRSASSQKMRFWVDEKAGRGDQLTTSDGIQISLSGSVNDKEEIAEGFQDSEPGHSKRIKLMGFHQEVASLLASGLESPPTHIKIEVEAQNASEQSMSPLGLTLKKTPSFLDLIEMKLSHGRNLSRSDVDSDSVKGRIRSEGEKLKASNFPANLLRIGTWNRVSIYEGDLIAKCYYAKRKLVWEVLDRGLKIKIEIQFSNISAIRAIFRDNEPDILEIELCCPPMFFRESNPQPRKHTLWQTSSDFTGGQAPIYRRHYVQFPGGTLERHYEKLLQCDNRLFMLSKKPFPTLHSSPYFYSDNLYGYPDFPFAFNGNPLSSQFPHLSVPTPNAMPLHQLQNFETIRLSFAVNDSTSPISVNCKQEHQKAPFWAQGINNDQILCSREGEVGELPLIVSTRQDRLLQLPCGDELVKNDHPSPPNHLLLNEIADHLLKDPFASVVCSDEQRILAKVKSMCNLLDMSREPLIPTGNTKTNYNFIDMEGKAYGGKDYKTNNHIMLRNMMQSTGGSDSLCLELLNWLPTQGCNENPLMNLTRCPSSPYFFVDPVMEDADACVHPHNRVNQR